MPTVKKDLYQAIKAALESVTTIKNVMHYNGQDLNNFEQENSKRFPQCWIQLTSTTWLPSELDAYNKNETRQQKSEAATITIYLATFSLNDDDDTFEADLDVVDEIYRALTNLDGALFSPLQRASEADVPTNNNVRIWTQEYTTKLTEPPVEAGLTDAAPVALIINKEILP
jgi:hypothetical protein